MIHSKIPGSEIDPERVHWGQTPFRIKGDPEISQLGTECDPEVGQSDPICCQVCRNLTNSRSSLTMNGVWPQWTLFWVTLTRVFLECNIVNFKAMVLLYSQLTRKYKNNYKANKEGFTTTCCWGGGGGGFNGQLPPKT